MSQQPRYAGELSEETIDLLFKLAPLHDVGKVAIPDAILLKPGKLTVDEWDIMKRHAEYGRDALQQAENDTGEAVGFCVTGVKLPIAITKNGMAAVIRKVWLALIFRCRHVSWQ